MDRRLVLAPSEVLVELDKKAGDDLHTWASEHASAFCPPEASWTAQFGTLRAYAPHWFAGTGKHDADPFVVAHALVEGLPVVTYEGVAFSGEPARVRTQNRAMPHVCAAVGVDVASMFDVLEHLGVVL
jgi:hypothetical protein